MNRKFTFHLTLAFSIMLSCTGSFAQLNFSPQNNVAQGTYPNDIAIIDVNGDGNQDLIFANKSSNTLSVFTSTGNGNYGSKVNLVVGEWPITMAVADINSDGKPDIAVVNQYANTVGVLLNNGGGQFSDMVTYPTGINPAAITLGDFTGDGKPDMMVTSDYEQLVSVYANIGNGEFSATRVNYGTGISPRCVKLLDVNSDQKADMVITSGGESVVNVFLNNGDGTFATKVDFTTGSGPNIMEIGDFNNDGKADIAVTNNATNTISVLTNTGIGGFGDKMDYQVGLYPYSIGVGDFNGDGNADLAVSDGYYSANFGISILTNTGVGTFGATIVIPTTTFGGYYLAVGDVNGDNKDDIVYPNDPYFFTNFINQAPSITTSITGLSSSLSLCNGYNTVLSVTATGSPRLGYQWFQNGIAVPGANASTLSITGMTSQMAGTYTVVVKGFGSVITSSGISLTSCNNALDFDGVNDYVQLSNDIPGGDNFTFSTWFNASTNSNKKILSSSNSLFEIALQSNNTIDVYTPNGNGNGGVVALNTWNHLAAVYTNPTMTVYLNGNVIYTFNVTGPIGTISNLRIGSHNAINGFNFGGKLDEMSFWNLALTPSEVQSLMNKSIPSTTPGLSAYFDFNNGISGGSNAGVNTLNEPKNANNGTVTNFALTGGNSNWLTSGATISGMFSFPAPTISGLTASQSVAFGSNLPLSVTATGRNISYQWLKDGSTISGANTSTYTLTGINSASAGTYAVVINSFGGDLTSSGINISYIPLPLTVTAFNASMVYGAANPIFTGTIVGLLNGDNVNVTYYVNGTSIIPSVTGVALSNYALTKVPGVLTIHPAQQTITGFVSLPTLTLGGGNYRIFGVSASSNLAVIYISSDVSVVSVSGNRLIPVGVGSATITASVPGNSNYLAVSSTLGITVIQVVTTATDDYASEVGVSVYPNPSNGTFTITTNTTKNYRIFSLTGLELQTGSLNEGINTISTQLETGSYLIQVDRVSYKLMVK